MEKETQQQSNSPRFKPLTSGLGLDHFSDGLPYTPSHLKRQRRAPLPITYPTQTVVSEKNLNAVEQLLKQAQEHSAVEETVEVQPEIMPAGITRRVCAYAVDFAFSLSVFTFIAWGGFKLSGFNFQDIVESRGGLQMVWPLFLFFVVVYLGYFLVQETTWKRTIGKKMLGISIQSHSGFSILARSFCFFLSIIPFGAGLLWCLFDSKKRCWHDLITDSEVILRS